MKIIKILLLFIIVSLFSTAASALSFANLSVGGTGSINTGNGYFDDEQTAFSYTGTSRNIYAIAEDTQVNILEPVGFAGGSSNAYQVINSSFGTITDAVVNNGYLYFVDGGTLKKKRNRGTTSPVVCESNDTSPGACIIVIQSGIQPTLRTLNNQLYYIVGTNLYHLDINDNSVIDFTVGTAPGVGGSHNGFTVANNGSQVEAYIPIVSVNNRLAVCKLSGCTIIYTGANNFVQYNTLFTTTNTIFVYWRTAAPVTYQSGYYIANSSAFAETIITTDINQYNRAYVGSQSTIGLWAKVDMYETFNSNEAGIDSLPVSPAQLTYDTKTITSLDSQYYNKSTIYLEYNVIINSLNANNLLLDFGDYRWMISMTDPNGVTTDVIQSPACSFSSLLDTTCQVTSTMGIRAPPAGWLQGSWNAKLYEINIVDASRALITTSSSFTVLNTTLENQSVIPPPDTNLPTSGTAPHAITLIDGFVNWLGMGVNSVSKLLFAMIFIAIAATVGLIWGNGNIAMVFAFVPYAFFTFIDYIPKWVFIIAILLIAIASRVFR